MLEPGDRPENTFTQQHAVGVYYGVPMLKLSLLTLAVVSSFAVVANTPQTLATKAADDAAVEHISIYANRQSKAVADTLSSVTVINRDEIIRRQVRDLPALLQQVAGVSVARDGGRGQSSSVFIRGGSSGHTLVLLDGVRIGSATLGYQSLAMVPVALIEKIEIIRGPKAAWYGSDALGGVIAITSRQGEKLEFNASLGSNKLAEVGLSGSQKTGDLTLFGSVGTAMADGFSAKIGANPDDDGFEQSYLNAGAEYQTQAGLWRWHSQLNDGFYEYDSDYGGDKSDTKQDSHQLDWSLSSGAFSHQVKLAHSIDSDINYGPKSPESLFETKRDEAAYQLTYALNAELNLLTGANWYQEAVQKDAPNYSADSRNNQSAFAGFAFDNQSWLFDGAVRHDNFSNYGSKNTYQLSAGYHLTSELTARFSQGTAFKVPTFNDLYWPKYGNPLLKPEESLARELGLNYQLSAVTVDVVVFDRDLTNLIQRGKQSTNVLLASIQGAEVSAAFAISEFEQKLSYAFLDGKDERTGLKLVKRPEHKISWLNSKTYQDWTFSTEALYQSRSFSGKDWEGNLQPELGSYVIWSAGVAYQWQPGITLRAKLDNLFDKNYQTNLGYRQAGLEFVLGVQMLAF